MTTAKEKMTTADISWTTFLALVAYFQNNELTKTMIDGMDDFNYGFSVLLMVARMILMQRLHKGSRKWKMPQRFSDTVLVLRTLIGTRWQVFSIQREYLNWITLISLPSSSSFPVVLQRLGIDFSNAELAGQISRGAYDKQVGVWLPFCGKRCTYLI